jgi:two-component system chemotaxis sensor kinase CheA
MAPPIDQMAEIRASFFVECEELLESLQDALTRIAAGDSDGETVNVVFRAVHSIKGGAGAFGLDRLVAFAHRYETVMDEVRSGRMAVDQEAHKQFFRAADCLADHVRAARDGAAAPPDSDEVLQLLEALMGGGRREEEKEDPADFQPLGLSLDLSLDLADDSLAAGAEDGGWEVTFRPTAELYASGNEPLLLLRSLSGLGEARITCDRSRLPPLSDLDPEESHLSWRIALPAGVTEDAIRATFDFVEDVAAIDISRAPAKTRPGPTEIVPDEPVPASGAAPETGTPAAAPSEAVIPVDLRAEPAATGMPARPEESGTRARADAPSGGAAPASPAASDVGATVRVDVDRIDRLVNLVGELVTNQSMLAQSVKDAGLTSSSPIQAGLEAFMMLTRDIQESVMMIRAQPVKPLFQRMARIVREASAAVGKNVRIRTEGEMTEVDKTVIERLADPLTHMIRNAVDHGIEQESDRLAAGKPGEGTITLSARHRSGRVVIDVSDDGAGINRPKVLEIAARKGLIPAEAELTDTEIDNLLFLPGFSTAATISNLSGRGVGMDVVKRSIQGLGGRITISSERGRGTAFSISLPLTLAVLDGMVVEVEKETLVVPLSVIVETATLSQTDVKVLGPTTSVIQIRGDFVPLIDLGVELGYRPPKQSYSGGIALLTATEDGNRAALAVDTIVEQRQVVIKGLQGSYGRIPGIAAATILGEGQVALILDPADLAAKATGRTRVTDLAIAG